MRFYITMVLLVAFAGCTTIEERHGAVLKPKIIQKIEPNTTKAQVISLLGSPSTKSSYGEQIWYYISNDQERNILSDDDLKEQQVLAIYFNDQDKVYNVETYGMEDAKNIAFATNKTPTAGRELTAIEQLLGNVGRFVPGNLTQRGSAPVGR